MRAAIITLVSAAVPQAAAKAPDSITLSAVVRDFIEHTQPGGHPDFEVTPSQGYALYEMNIAPQLGADSKPVFIGGGKYVFTQWRTSAATGSKPICYTLFNPGEPYFDQDAVLGSGTSNGGIQSATSFSSWFNDSPGINLSQALELTFHNHGGSYVFDDQLDPLYSALGGFFPIDNQMFGNSPGTPDHNFHFTVELHSSLRYFEHANQFFNCTGDDDIWVFIDGKLVIDLGGIHSAKSQVVDLNRLQLVNGAVYPISFFFAERHRSQSRCRIETNVFNSFFEMPGDIDASGQVDIDDLLLLIANIGACPAPQPDCPADINHDGHINGADLLIIITNWGFSIG